MAVPPPTPPQRRYGLPPRLRLRGQKAFASVFAHRLRHNCGPLSICARPNALAFTRLGLSVAARVGSAVKRNRIKRLLREAFRLSQHDLPGGYDLVVVVRPHEPSPLRQYRHWLTQAAATLDLRARQRAAEESTRETP